MYLSSRVKSTSQSATLKMNEEINRLISQGNKLFNLTGGELSFKAPQDFNDNIKKQLNFIKSFQYSPVGGFEELREHIESYLKSSRSIDFESEEFGVSVANGSKHIIYNILGSMVDPGDEVIIIAPYWVSYPEMIRFWGGEPVVVQSHLFDSYTPHIEDIKKAMGSRTRAIIVNSPNNPAGVHYSKEWMEEFANLLADYPDVAIISDEVYYEISYFDPKPTYFYQLDELLLHRTFIVGSISKMLASAGLRLGYCLGPLKIIEAMNKLQSQTTSGANSLIQRALIDYDFSHLTDFLSPVLGDLRYRSEELREAFRSKNLSHCWYQTNSAFFFLIDFSRTPLFSRFHNEEEELKDYSEEICEYLLHNSGIAVVPGHAFGYPNAARVSLTLDSSAFVEAISMLVNELSCSK